MSEEFESIELEVSEEDILYYLVDEDDNPIGFAVMEDGEEVEYYFDDADSVEIEYVGDADEGDEEVIELEVSEDDIVYHIVNEDGEEIGFAILEDGEEVEYYFDGSSADQYEAVDSPETSQAAGSASRVKSAIEEEPEKHGYLYKMASIAGHTGNKARKRAEVELGKVRGKAEKQVDRATNAVEAKSKELKAKKDEAGLGITRDDIVETTSDLNVIAKEGAETAKELKAAYDDIMDSFGFLVPNKVRRRLP